LKAGGHLDSEFFPESIGRRSFPDLAIYSAFLRRRGVDTVIVFKSFDVRWKTNEHQLLEELVTADHCSPTQVGATVVERFERFDVYRIQRTC
jgi:hypothetical protein